MKELIGAAVAAASALLYDAGYILEKQALVELPPLRLSPVGLLRTATRSRRWLAGFAAMLAGLGLQVVALTLAPVSVVQPILAAGLIALAAAGSAVLGERLSRRHLSALVLVVSAVVVVGASARGGQGLARAVPGGRFVLVVAAIAIAAGLARLAAGNSFRASAPGLAGVSVAAGLLYGLGALAEKAVAVGLARHGMVAGALDALATPYPWIFLVATFAGMVLFQVGLQAYPASLMASLSNITSTVCALIGASLVFGEAVLPNGWWSVVRVAGFGCVVGSVVLLAAERGPLSGSDRTRPDHAVAP